MSCYWKLYLHVTVMCIFILLQKFNVIYKHVISSVMHLSFWQLPISPQRFLGFCCCCTFCGFFRGGGCEIYSFIWNFLAFRRKRSTLHHWSNTLFFRKNCAPFYRVLRFPPESFAFIRDVFGYIPKELRKWAIATCRPTTYSIYGDTCVHVLVFFLPVMLFELFVGLNQCWTSAGSENEL